MNKSDLDITIVESELKKRFLYPYQWGQKQNDFFDNQTNFIYHTFLFEDLLKEIKTRFNPEIVGNDYDKYFNYTINRWYNFWSAQAVEKIFCSLPNVSPAIDEKDHLIDFTIQGFTFDHKTSVYPKNYNKSLREAIINTDDLINWLYKNQSQEKRMHLKNRLFIVLYSTTGEAWKLKAEITLLKKEIEYYMIGFNPHFLMKFKFEEENETLSDIIWVIK
ncbi:MAG TPA: hypothetical protein VLN45_09380 [Ignavibacteriaceae bacterium]|nr:hypothetical protein [Ignavibacteriaceae bacterium]